MKKVFYIVILLNLSVLISCRKEFVQPSDELVNVGFSITMPYTSRDAVKTYAISSADENVIYQIILLAFKVSGGAETFAYYKQGMQIYSGAAPNEKSFYVPLLKSTDHYRFVLLINGGNQISSIVSTLAPNTEKSDVMEQLVYNISTKWDTTPSAYTPLPMWGEGDEIAGINNQTVLPGIPLLRSLARVDITLSGDALTNFTIESAHVYGERDKLLMAPLPANLDMSLKPINPSIPAGAGILVSQDYLFSAATSVVREIYIPEAEAGDTWIVIGGKRDGDPTTYYYRLDFEDVFDTPLPVLRNARYVLNITEVNSIGAAIPGALAIGASVVFKQPPMAKLLRARMEVYNENR